MADEWYYTENGQSRGPIPREQLLQMVRSGIIRASEHVWNESMKDWESVSSLRLNEIHMPTPPPPPVQCSQSARPGLPHAVQRQSHRSLYIFGVVAIALVFMGAAVFWPKPEPAPPARTVATKPTTQPARVATAPAAAVTATSSAAVREERSAASTPEPMSQEPPANASTLNSTAPLAAVPSSVPVMDASVTARSGAPQPPPITSTPEPSFPQNSPTTSPQQVATVPTVLFQEVEIKRQPQFGMPGMTTTQRIHYRVLSELTIQPPDETEVRNVVLIVKETQLIEADDLSRASFASSLEKMKLQQYTFAVKERGEVVRFTGHKKNLAELPVDLAAANGLMITSVIDEDGWRELAELTFFRPDDEQEKAKPWKRQMAHDWGSLGRWSGMTSFVQKPKQRDLHVFEYTHNMKHTPDAKGAAGTMLQIRDARFATRRAGGQIFYNPEERRVTSVEEVFDVAGTVQAELLGQAVPIELQELQHIAIRVSAQGSGEQ